jgi:ComF family protein
MDIDHSYGFGSALLDFFLPRRCVVCDAVLAPSETHLCENCWSDLPHTYYWLLRNNPMSDRLNAFIQDWLEAKWSVSTGTEHDNSDDRDMADVRNDGHEANVSRTERYAYAAALFFYRAESDYSKITRCIKYQGRVEVGLHFGMLLGDRLAESHLFSDVDAVVPVPLHWMRRWKRGYNQAEVMASGVSRRLGVPMRSDILRRCRRTRTQTKLSVDEKKANVAGAFAVHKQVHAEELPFRHILIIDDVFTTGSTLMACFTALREVFPPSVRISIATLGFVGGP